MQALQRRTRCVCALVSTAFGITLVAGCVGTSPQPSPASSVTSKTSSDSPTDAATKAAIQQAFVDFFNGTTAAVDKVALVQHGSAFADVINRQAGSSLAKGTTATVSKVVMLSPTEANVVYTVELAGSPALANVTGVAVDEGGAWKVSAETFCTLLQLEQQAPPICQHS